MRAVVDTNVWVSALLNPEGYPGRVLNAFRDERFDLVISEPLLAELSEVLTRPRLAARYRLTQSASRDLVSLLRRRAHLVSVRGTVQICRDPDDDVVIETALRGRADVLVTRDDDLKGDRDLAVHLATQHVQVMTVDRFLNELP